MIGDAKAICSTWYCAMLARQLSSDGRRLCLETLSWLDRVRLVVFCFLLIVEWRAQQRRSRGACCSLKRENVILVFIFVKQNTHYHRPWPQ